MFSLKNLWKGEKGHHFLITSHGQTATLWLAGTLNTHPHLFCSHGYSYPVREAQLREVNNAERNQRRTDIARFWTLSLNEFWSEQKAATEKHIIGNVHGYQLGYFLNNISSLSRRFRRNLKIMNMSRHPITRVSSIYNTYVKPYNELHIGTFVEQTYNTKCRYLIDFLNAYYDVKWYEPAPIAFIAALYAIDMITQEIGLAQKKGILNIRFEDVTQNKECLRNIIDYISDGKADTSDEVIDQIFTQKKVNKHNHMSASDQAEQQYQSWEEWQKGAFNYLLKRKGFLEINEALGYDFSFIRSQKQQIAITASL